MTDHTAAAVAAAIRNTTPRPPNDDHTARQIADATAHLFQLDPQDLLGPSRDPTVVHARQVAMTVTRSRTAMSYPRIGRWWQRDHTTVMNAVSRVMGNPVLLGYAAAVEAALTAPELAFDTEAP